MIKIKKYFYIVSLILVFSVTIFGQSPDWYMKVKQIKPLESSKEDVEKVFIDVKVAKSFIDKGEEYVFYDHPEGNLFIKYSVGKCSVVKEAPFNVDQGKVIQVIFSPFKREAKFSKFKLKKSDFSIEKEIDTSNFSYISKMLGITFGVYNGKVMNLQLFPSSKFESLKCENIKANK